MDSEMYKKKFAIPRGQFIGDGAEKLYELEAERNKVITAAAEEHGKMLGHNKKQFWTHSLAEQLYSTLDSYEKSAAEAAAIGFLRSRNFTVEYPKS